MRGRRARRSCRKARYAHLVGGGPHGSDPETSVVDKFGRIARYRKLFVCDGSILPTQGSANPGLTIQALAAPNGGLPDLSGRSGLQQGTRDERRRRFEGSWRRLRPGEKEFRG